jgi:restriction system protein
MGLGEAEFAERLPSGGSRIENRVRWAAKYMKEAQLLERPGRGKIRITEKGKQVLSEGPARIDIRFLSRYPEFLHFRTGGGAAGGGESTEVPQPEEALTPEETIEKGYQAIRASLKKEILERVGQVSPAFFEKLVVDLLLNMGYGGSRAGAGQAIGRTGDDGVDGVINEDRLGLDVIYIQAKKWSRTVGRPELQAFVGSLEGKRANKGIFITTSSFSSEAEEYSRRVGKKLVLIDGERLAEHMIDFGVGVTPVTTYEIRRIDGDYFSEE